MKLLIVLAMAGALSAAPVKVLKLAVVNPTTDFGHSSVSLAELGGT